MKHFYGYFLSSAVVSFWRKNAYKCWLTAERTKPIVVVRIFNATRHPKHIEAAATKPVKETCI